MVEYNKKDYGYKNHLSTFTFTLRGDTGKDGKVILFWSLYKKRIFTKYKSQEIIEIFRVTLCKSIKKKKSSIWFCSVCVFRGQLRLGQKHLSFPCHFNFKLWQINEQKETNIYFNTISLLEYVLLSPLSTCFVQTCTRYTHLKNHFHFEGPV